MTPHHAAKLRREIRFNLDDIEVLNREIAKLQAQITLFLDDTRMKQILLWRHEQSVDDSTGDAEIVADDLFYMRFPNHEAI